MGGRSKGATMYKPDFSNCDHWALWSMREMQNPKNVIQVSVKVVFPGMKEPSKPMS